MGAQQFKHAGTLVTISDDGTTEVVRDGVEVGIYPSGQLVAHWAHPFPRTMVDAGPDDEFVRLVGPDGQEHTMASGFQPSRRR